jgi:hypothetical protein
VVATTVRVHWGFGATTNCSIDQLCKLFPRQPSHRYIVKFETIDPRKEVEFTVATGLGERMAIHLASTVLASRDPLLHPWAIEVTDLGTVDHAEPYDLTLWYEFA